LAYDWIIAHDSRHEKPYRMECLRCGETMDVKTPVSIKDYAKIADAFTEKHKNCKETIDTDWAFFPTCPYCGYEDEDYSGFDNDGDTVECECPNCEKEYMATMHLDVNFSSEKKDEK